MNKPLHTKQTKTFNNKIMHPVKLRAAISTGPLTGRGQRRVRKAGFLGPLLGLAAPLLGSVLPGLIDRIFPRRQPRQQQQQGEGMMKGRRKGGMTPANFTMRFGRLSKKGGLGAPYGGRMKRRGCGAFQPGPLA